MDYIVYDPLLKVIWGVGFIGSPSLHYAFVSINPTTLKCSASAIKTAEFGIATAYSYDPYDDVIYIGWAPNGPGKIYKLNVITGALQGVVLSPESVITDLEVEF